MARIRTIKPGFFTNEKLCSLAPATHMLAAGLLTYADDDGYFNANPKLIAAAIFPLRDSLSVPGMLNELSGIGWLRLGKGEDGRAYGHIVHFTDHQKINRPTPSKIAPLTIAWDSPAPPRALTEPSLLEGKGKERNKERKGPPTEISENVKKWAKEKGYDYPEASLAYLLDYAAANGKDYDDWDAALRNCIKADWGKAREMARKGTGKTYAPASHKCSRCGDGCGNSLQHKGNIYCQPCYSKLKEDERGAELIAKNLAVVTRAA